MLLEKPCPSTSKKDLVNRTRKTVNEECKKKTILPKTPSYQVSPMTKTDQKNIAALFVRNYTPHTNYLPTYSFRIEKYDTKLPNYTYTIPSPKLIRFIQLIETNSLKQKTFTVKITPECRKFLMPVFRPTKDPKDPLYLFNHNMNHRFFSTFNKWIHAQKKYVSSLPWQDKLTLLNYTYLGDKILNQFLLGVVRPREFIPNKNSLETRRFQINGIYPLCLYIYQAVQDAPDQEQFMSGHKPLSSHILPFFVNVYKNTKSQPFYKSYYLIFSLLVKYRSFFRASHLIPFIQKFRRDLERVLHNAPKTTFSFWVYRGLKTKDFMETGKKSTKYMFTNHLFMSTSYNLCRAIEFKHVKSPCCIQQILVTKDIPCVLISLISFFSNENEILFPPEQNLYPLTDDYIASNVHIDTRKFILK